MPRLGEDLQRWAGPVLYHPVSGASAWAGIGLAVILFLAYLVVQAVSAGLASVMLFGTITDERLIYKAAIIATLPASLIIAAIAWLLAKAGRSHPAKVLSLRWPQFTLLGWLAIVGLFIVGMYALAVLVTVVFNIDPAQYTPRPDGSSPETGSAGIVKEAMFAMANNPLQFAMAFLSVSIGAPVAEELVFRGQLFASLSRTRLGKSGAVLVTTTLWSLMHATEPWLTVGLIFAMGLVLGCLLLRFGSLYLTMICHGVWNAAYSVIIFGGLGS